MLPLKMAADLEYESEFLSSSLRLHTPKVAWRLGRKWSHLGDADEVAGNAEATLRVLERDLAEDREKMLEANHRNAYELGDDPMQREERDAATAELRRRYIRARDLYTITYGEPAATAHGFKAVTARVPHRLLAQVEHLLKSLAKTTAPELPDDDVVDWSMDHAKLVAHFEPHRARLEAAIAGVLAQMRAAEATQIARRKAMARHQEKFDEAANYAERVYILAGMTEEAARLRPIMRRVRRRVGDIDEIELARAIVGDKGPSPGAREREGGEGPPAVPEGPPSVTASAPTSPQPSPTGRRPGARTREASQASPPARARTSPTSRDASDASASRPGSRDARTSIPGAAAVPGPEPRGSGP